MNLLKMNRTELLALQSKLHVIGTAVDHLAQNGLEPLVSLSGEACVITADPILSFGPLAELVLVDPIFEAPPPLTASAEIAQPEASAIAVSKVAEQVESEFVSGPVTDAEKSQIEELHKSGLSNTDIAKRLSRRPNIVGSHLYYLKRRAEAPATAPQSTKPAPQKEVRERAISLAAPQSEETPVGEPEGLQQHSPAEHEPVQSGQSAAMERVAYPTKSEAEPEFFGENLRIWLHVKGLGFPKGWDADLDLEMCEGFGRGMKVDRLAVELGVDSKLIRDRYAEVTACIRDNRGHISIDRQERLVKILRDRLKALRGGAKAA